MASVGAVMPDSDPDPVPMLVADNTALLQAGGKLAEAAAFVIREKDGLHRLALALAEWYTTIASEGGRGERHGAE